MIGLAVASGFPAWAADEPQKAPEDEASVIAGLRADAEDGKAASKASLADVLAYGEGATPERRAEAATWYRRAAEQGDAESQFTIGLWLWQGQDLPRDRVEAVKWFRKGAEQGQAQAQFWLADAYETGEGGLDVDMTEAAKWYRRSAEQGDDESQSSLGLLYANGTGVPQDDAQAVAWLKKAADQHSISGQHQLAVMYAAGRGVPKDEKEAVRLYGMAADRDFTVSMTALGEANEQGRGTDKNLVCAYFWYGLAGKRGFSVGDDDRDELAPKLSAAERAEGERLVAAADFLDGVLQRPLCPTETLSVDVTNAALGDLLNSFETTSGREIRKPEGIADLTVTAKLDDLTWEKALTEVLKGKGLEWKRDGEAIQIVRKAKKK